MFLSKKPVLLIFFYLWSFPLTYSKMFSFKMPWDSMGHVDPEQDFMKDNAKMPDNDVFLAQLLDTQPNQVLIMAKNFSFVNSTTIDKVRILHYGENGKYKEYTLLQKVPIDPSQPIKFVIHGWQSQGTADWVKNITHSYHIFGTKQTLALDWSPIADKNYFKAAGCVEHVGITVAEYFWRIILQEKAENLKNIHVIGHSLGAHVSAFFGKHIKKVSGGQYINRISALDAAAPLFEYPIHRSSSERIDEHDAEFVDGFHTNAGFLGFSSAFGNHDYYISYGGPIQPGCSSVNIISAFKCSHSKAHIIYNLTINNDMYLARHCDNSLLMFAKLCKDNVLSIVGEQNNSTDIDGQFFIYVDSNGKPVYPWEQSGLLWGIWDWFKGCVGYVVNGVRKLF